MDIVAYVKIRFAKTETAHCIIGKDTVNGVLECGFMRKPDSTGNDVDIVFSYYGALLVIEGHGVYIGEDGVEIPIEPGCFVQRIPGQRHSTIVKADGQWLEVFVCFGKELYSSLEKIGVLNTKPILYPGIDPSLIQDLLRLFEEMKAASVHLLPALLGRAVGIVINVYALDSVNKERTENDFACKACRIIEKSRYSDISVSKIAAQMNMGYEYFRKTFKAKMGISPHYYIIRTKINTAKSLLLNQEKSIKEIAFELGYPDQFAFSKQFKALAGVSPTEFRQSFS